MDEKVDRLAQRLEVYNQQSSSLLFTQFILEAKQHLIVEHGLNLCSVYIFLNIPGTLCLCES